MKHIVVIGAGVIGLTTAHALRKHGCDVTVVESHGGSHGASVVNAGWICPALSEPVPAPGLVKTSLRWMLRSNSPLYIKPSTDLDFLRWLIRFWRHCNVRDFTAGLEATATLNVETIRLYDEMSASGVHFQSHRDGIVFAFHSPTALAHAFRALEPYRRYGVTPNAPLWGKDIRELEPALSDAINGGFWFPGERSVRPDSLTAGLVDWLEERMVDIQTNTAIQRFVTSGRNVTGVETSNGRIAADAVVIAAGVWSGSLARQLGVNLPIQGGKGYSLDYAPPPTPLSRPVDFAESRFACTPMEGMVRLAGTMELSGINDLVRPQRVAAIARAASRGLRDWPANPSAATVRSGLRPMTPDGLPIIGWLPGHSNVAIATGHGMLGVTLAAATAANVAEMVITGRTPDVLEPFSATRFV